MKKIFTLSVFLLCALFLRAQLGGLDPSFNSVGYRQLPGLGNDTVFSISVQNNSKIVLVGNTYHSSDYDISVIRLNADGSLDASFATDGNNVLASSSNEFGRSSLIQSDGKILVAGFVLTPGISPAPAHYDILLYRLNVDGSLDASFGGGRVVTSLVNTNELAYSIAMQPDGKIVVVGSSNNNFAVFRYLPNGSPDPDFKANLSAPSGYVITQVGTGINEAKSVAIQDDGKILVAGSSVNSNSDFALVRYNSDGTIDDTFDGDANANGIIISNLGGVDVVSALKLFSNRILVAGTTTTTSSDYAIAEYDVNGKLDPLFGINGISIIDIQSNSNDNLVGFSITDQNSIILGGESNEEYCAIRLSPTGQYDSQKTIVDVGGTILAEAMQSFQNRIYIVGKVWDNFSIAAILNSELALPIQLKSFLASSNGNAVELTWSGSAESKSSLFEIERSLDGKKFTRIGQVAVSSNLNAFTSYSFTDFKPSSINHYRLKMIDIDGKVAYSKIVVVRNSAANHFEVNPNPALSIIQVSVADPSVSMLTIYSSTGIPVHKVHLPTANGTRTVPVDVSGLTRGIYYIKAGNRSLSFSKL